MKRLRAFGIVRSLALVALTLFITGAAIAAGLTLTPMQEVHTIGQVVKVGATRPALNLSGPGELDLFGQQLPTKLNFPGPVRPRLQLTQITLDHQVTGLVRNRHGGHLTSAIGPDLADGWIRYVAWQDGAVAVASIVLAGAGAGWWRLHRRGTVILISINLILAQVVNLGLVAVTATTAPDLLRQVQSMGDLVGASPVAALAAVPGPNLPTVQAVVIGDSTAAGVGNPAPAHPSAEDTACHRSSAAFAQVLAQINGWTVKNLACSGATVAEGLLGPQRIGKTTVPAQVALAAHATEAQFVIVSTGANDVQWSTMMAFCAAYDCVDWATTAYFQQELATFSRSYYTLIQHLAVLPGRPQVLVNLYYNPFGPDDACLNAVGLTPQRKKLMIERLQALNGILRQGAEASSFLVAEPDFSGHGVCSAVPYVQGLKDRAPFHPTVSGELAIALTDDHVLRSATATASSAPASPGQIGPSTG